MFEQHETKKIIEEIIDVASPEKIIIFSHKKSMAGETTSLKLCVIAAAQDKTELRRRIYVKIASDISYDVVIYTPDEWARFAADSDSFAYQIDKEGQVIYG